MHGDWCGASATRHLWSSHYQLQLEHSSGFAAFDINDVHSGVSWCQPIENGFEDLRNCFAFSREELEHCLHLLDSGLLSLTLAAHFHIMPGPEPQRMLVAFKASHGAALTASVSDLVPPS